MSWASRPATDASKDAAFRRWATLPSYQDLATGRVIHFFFAWLLVGTLVVWLIASIVNGHLLRDVVPRRRDLGNVGGDVADHLRFRFDHSGRYGPLQKLSYAAVLLVLLPLMVMTGLTMSPGWNAAHPWMLDLFGGRQSARTLHFAVMVALILFFVVHIVMVVAAGPFNEMRSIVTGWYRTSPSKGRHAHEPGPFPSSASGLSRRAFLVAASGVALSGCDVLDPLARRDSPVRRFMAGANGLTYRAQRWLIGNASLAREYTEADIRQPQRPNGITDPQDADYRAFAANSFADWRLTVDGMVDRPSRSAWQTSGPCPSARR